MRCSMTMAAAFAALVVTGCGGGSGGDGDKDAGVKKSMEAWAAAATPAQGCRVMSNGFRIFVSDGRPDRCAATASNKLGGFDAQKVSVEKVTHEDGQAVVRAEIAGQTADFYFVEEGKEWKLNSIGVRKDVAGPMPGQ